MLRHPWQTGILAACAIACSGLALPAQAAPNKPGEDPNSDAELMRSTARLSAQIDAQSRMERRMQEIREQGGLVPEPQRKKLDASLRVAARRTDRQAETFPGEIRVVRRLAKEFGMTQDDLVRQRNDSGQGWGDLVIAHTLSVSTPESLTADELLEMHAQGTEWGRIAAGLRLRLGEVKSAVQMETNVAVGVLKADARVAGIHASGADAGGKSGTGARAEVEAAPPRADAGSRAEYRAGLGVELGN